MFFHKFLLDVVRFTITCPIFGVKAENLDFIRVFSEKKRLILCKIPSIIRICLGELVNNAIIQL